MPLPIQFYSKKLTKIFMEMKVIPIFPNFTALADLDDEQKSLFNRLKSYEGLFGGKRRRRR